MGHVPLGFVGDLAALVTLGEEAPFASEGHVRWSSEVRSARFAYENEVLQRLLSEPAFQDARDLAVGHSEASEHLLGLLLGVLGPCWPRRALVNPAHTRSVLAPAPESDVGVFEAAHRALCEELGDPRWLLDQLRLLTETVELEVRLSQVLGPEDLFELRHAAVLRAPEMRLGCRQVLALRRRLGRAGPRHLRPPPELPEADTPLTDLSTFPRGGFAELSRRGPPESLLPSELAFLDPSMRIDLFDLRFVEHELCYFARDSGQLRRRRRTVHLVCDLGPLTWAKSAGYEAQFVVLCHAIFLRLVRDLRDLFSRDALRFRLWYLGDSTPPGQVRMAQEAELMRLLLLADEVPHGWASVETTARLSRDDLAEEGRRCDTLVLCGEDAATWRALPNCLVLRLVDSPTADPLTLPVRGAELPVVASALDRLVVAVASGLSPCLVDRGS